MTVRDMTLPSGSPNLAQADALARAPTVFVLHEDPEVCKQVRALVEAAGLATRTCCDAASLFSELSLDQPGCLVLGSRIDSLTAPELQCELTRRGIDIPTIVDVGCAEVSLAVSALRAGAVEVIEHPLLWERLVAVILRAIAADLHRRSHLLARGEVRRRYAELTAREREVLEFVVEGATSSAIAKQLGIREKTVEVYRSHINRKMRARNAVELARMVYSVR